MSLLFKRKFRVYATGTHSATVDIFADSPEEATALASQIDLQNYDVGVVHPGNPIIDGLEEIEDNDDEATDEEAAALFDTVIAFAGNDPDPGSSMH